MPRFFGLTPTDKSYYLEHIFLLMYYMGFAYVEVYNIPIWQRTWFIERVNKELKKSGEGGNRAAHTNSPDAREMMGRARSQVPAKLRRFT